MSKTTNEDYSSLQQYFEEVRFVYDKNGNDTNIEYSPENREKLIEMNLKCVIKIAKSFLGMGLTLEELISAGNEGLCRAFKKYKPEKNMNRDILLTDIENMNDDISVEWVEDKVGELCRYGKLKTKFDKFIGSLKDAGTVDKKTLYNWVNKNIKKASFNSVAMLWVTAAMRQELSNHSKLVRKVKKADDEASQKKDVYIDVNSTINDKGGITYAEVLDIREDSTTDLDIDEAHKTMHDLLKTLFEGVKTRDKRILLQRFGVGYPRPLLPREISEREKVSIARVSQIISYTLSKMRDNARRYDIDPEEILQLLDQTNRKL